MSEIVFAPNPIVTRYRYTFYQLYKPYHVTWRLYNQIKFLLLFEKKLLVIIIYIRLVKK